MTLVQYHLEHHSVFYLVFEIYFRLVQTFCWWSYWDHREPGDPRNGVIKSIEELPDKQHLNSYIPEFIWSIANTDKFSKILSITKIKSNNFFSCYLKMSKNYNISYFYNCVCSELFVLDSVTNIHVGNMVLITNTSSIFMLATWSL